MESHPSPKISRQPLPRPLQRCWRVTTALLAMLTLGLMLATTACNKPAAVTLPPPIVIVAPVVPTNAPATAEFIGQLDSPNTVQIRARTEGFVDKIIFTDGTEVKAGDPLFKLDDKPYQERLAAANGALAEANAALNKYQKDVARLTPLAEKHAVPQQDLDNAIASVDVGKAGVLSAEAQVQSATLDVNYCDIRSPINGLIGASAVAGGDFVGKGEPTLLATISELDPIWFYCNVSEVDYLRASAEIQRTGKSFQDLPITLMVGDGSTHPETGKFVFVDRTVDPKTGTLRVRAEFANPQRLLRPGMFARISVDLGTRPNSILVPERAVAELQGNYFVWVIDAENKANRRPVKVGRQVGEQLLILEGLQPGERLVVEGLQKVRDGLLVKPMTAREMLQAVQAAQAAAATPANN